MSLLKLYYTRPSYNLGPILILLNEGEYDKIDITLGDYYKIKKIVVY